MFKKRHAVLLMATVGQLCWLSFACADDADGVRIVPIESNEVLANPGKRTSRTRSRALERIIRW